MFLIIAISQEIFEIDTWGAVTYSLGHGRKHMLAILPTIWRPGLSHFDYRTSENKFYSVRALARFLNEKYVTHG